LRDGWRDIVARIWARDAAVWPPGEDDPARRLGWLDLPETMNEHVPRLRKFADDVRGSFDTVVLLGMGGSSLAPEVFARVFARDDGAPRLVVLDSTHPVQIRTVAAALDLGRTLFLVSSKSGTTIETMSLFRFFRSRCEPDQFVGITDPATPLEELATSDGFRALFSNPPDIGGRYSALSLFGLIPAALLGVDPERLLAGADAAARRCRNDALEDNPGLELGMRIGAAAAAGRDKLTFLVSERLAPFADWIEQLIAESTGKNGRGIAPVVREPPVPATDYGDDRAFVHVRFGNDPSLDVIVSEVAALAHPVTTVNVPDQYTLGGEIFRWEFATAVASAVVGVNAFDQPDVESAKQAAREFLGAPDAPPWPEEDPARFFEHSEPRELGCLLAFAPVTEENERVLRAGRRRVVTEHGLATSAGFGPRYLHSTGQLHKGGPRAVRALVILDEPQDDLDIPGAAHGFGQVITAQARGDADALAAAGKHVACTTWNEFKRWAEA
jgi:transaldolase / glucose-6-phosphate isomerase